MQCCGLCHQLSCSGKSALTARTVLYTLSSQCSSLPLSFPPLLPSSLLPSHPSSPHPPTSPFLSSPLLIYFPSCSPPTFFLAFSLLILFILLPTFPSSSPSSFPSSSLRYSMAWALSCIGVAHFYRLVTDFGGYHLDFTGYTINETIFRLTFSDDIYLSSLVPRPHPVRISLPV